MKFKYEGFNVGGQVTSGEVEATSREEAAENLRDTGLYVQQLKEVGVEEFKPVLPQKQQADDFTEGLGFKPLRPKEEPKQEAPKQRDVIEEQEDKRIFEGLVRQAELEETKEVLKKEQKEEDTKKEACPEGCQCGHSCSEAELERDVDDVLMRDISHLMAAGTDTQMLMKAMYGDNPEMYSVMRGFVQDGLAHALGQLLVESVVRRKEA